jgi:hypothetical protein
MGDVIIVGFSAAALSGRFWLAARRNVRDYLRVRPGGVVKLTAHRFFIRGFVEEYVEKYVKRYIESVGPRPER